MREAGRVRGSRPCRLIRVRMKMQQLYHPPLWSIELDSRNSRISHAHHSVNVRAGLFHLSCHCEAEQILPKTHGSSQVCDDQTSMANLCDHCAATSAIASPSTSMPSSNASSVMVSGGPILIDSRPV